MAYVLMVSAARVVRYHADCLAAKHIPGGFWTPFCLAAGVFCTGEVYGSDIKCVTLTLSAPD